MAELEDIYCRQYGANVYQMAQQKGSKLRNYVTVESMKGSKRFFDRVNPTTAVEVSTKYADTPLIPTEFDRRAVHAHNITWADMVDWQDDLNLFIDPTSSITKMGAYAMGRKIDSLIINYAFSGPAYEGEDGLTTVAYKDAQKIAVTTGGSGSNVGLNIEKLIQIRSMFGKADIDLEDPENSVYLACTQAQLDDLLRTTEVKSADYNSVKALVEGTVKRFMGIEFIRTGLLPKTALGDGYSRMCAAWCKSGVILAIPQDISMKVSTRPDKNENWQALAKGSFGATRLEDEKVIQVYCYEA